MARDLYAAAYSWLGHVRGGLAHATIARLRRLCRGVGIERRVRGDHGQGLPAGDGALQLQPPACHRRDRGRRHARHPDPAEHGVRHLRAAHRAVDRAAAARRHPARPAADGDLHGDDHDLDALQAALRPAGPARQLEERGASLVARRPDDDDRRWSASAASTSGVFTPTEAAAVGAALAVRLCAVAAVARQRRAVDDPDRNRQDHRAGVPDSDRRAGVRAVPGA